MPKPKMTAAQARVVFNKMIALETDADRRAELELLREYFTNPPFRKAFHDEIARINGVAA